MKTLLALLVLLLASPGCQEETWTVAPVKPNTQNGQKGPEAHQRQMPVMGNWQTIKVNVEELSGLCMNIDTTAFWAVGDEGAVCKVSFDGAVTPVLNTDLDLEGITIDPGTGDLYVAVEGDQMVCRIHAPDYKTLDTLFYVREAVERDFDNSGLEGIAFYKDSTLLVGSQEDAMLWAYRLDGKQLTRISLCHETSRIDEVAGLFYDAPKNWLWVTDSDTQRLFIFQYGTFDLLAYYDVPFIDNAESICVDRAHNCVWVGSDEDTPRLYRINFGF